MNNSTTTPTVNPGDVFVSSWGYDQTNVDVYYVESVTASGKSVRVVPGAKSVKDNGPTLTIVPVNAPANPGAETETKKVLDAGSGRYARLAIKVGYNQYAFLWDGEREFTATGYGWGH